MRLYKPLAPVSTGHNDVSLDKKYTITITNKDLPGDSSN
jgi:hypothetical protein